MEYDRDIKPLLEFNNQRIDKYIKNTPTRIYHYTSPEVLNSILSKKALRFTDRNYLNDYSEGRYVMKLCKNGSVYSLLSEELQEQFNKLCDEMCNNPLKKKVPTYQCSFSLDDDSLPMWNYFSKNGGLKGYNVSFLSSDLINNIKTSSYNNEVDDEQKLRVFGGKVIYEEDEQMRIINNIISNFASVISGVEDKGIKLMAVGLLVDKLLFVGSFFKANCFNYENEYRLLIMPTVKICGNKSEYWIIDKNVESFTKNGLIIPYIDLEFRKQDLISIGVSPTLEYDEVKSNLLNALFIYSYNNVEINKSTVPVRY